MISPEIFFIKLKNEGFDFFTGVPDSLLKNICSYISDNVEDSNHIIAANEGGALSLAIGYNLATGKIPLVYMQNSGIGNAINPLLSLADKQVYSIPMLLFIGWRGQPDIAFKDEPQHMTQGKVMQDLFAALKLPYSIVKADTKDNGDFILQKAMKHIRENNTPYALLVEKDTFTKYKIKKQKVFNMPILREQAIELILDNIGRNDIVVATTGLASREVFEYRYNRGQDNKQDFLTVGGMGHANQIALAIALNKPKRKVYCLDGDGAFLMHMGGVAIAGSRKANNFKHIIFNNSAHDSVGGQPTICGDIDILSVAKAFGYDSVFSVCQKDEIKQAITNLTANNKPSLLEIKISKGYRDNLGRPTLSPQQQKENFINFIRDY